MKYSIGDIVLIKKYKHDAFNERGEIVGYCPSTDVYHVRNTEPPFIGTVDGYFYSFELEPLNENVSIPIIKIN